MGGGERTPEQHLTMAELGRLMRGEMSRADTRAAIAHLRAGCEDCEVLMAPVYFGLIDPRRIYEPPAAVDVEPRPDPYDVPITRALHKVKAVIEARNEANAKVEREVLHILEEDGGSATGEPISSQPQELWAYCEMLLNQAVKSRGESLGIALLYATRAVSVAMSLTKGPYPAEALADLRTRAWAELGNLRRAANQLEQAEEAFSEANRYFAEGTGAPPLAARLADLLGSLCRAQRRFTEARTLWDIAHELYLAEGERHLAGRVLVNLSLAAVYAGEPGEALEPLHRAFLLLDAAREPALILSASHNALLALVDFGDVEGAAQLLWRTRRLYTEHGTPLDQQRLLGLEAKIASGRGERARAERLFREVIAGFEKAGLAYDMALVSLELAALLLEAGRGREVITLVDEMLYCFLVHRIHPEAMMAIHLFRQGVELGNATAEVARLLAEELRRLEDRSAPAPPPEG